MNFNGTNFDTYLKDYPDEKGYFGPYGGIYVSPELKAAMEEIADAYFTICKSRKFIAELRRIRKEFQGRPTPISHLERLSASLGNVQLYAKREDLNHTGAHKLNHCMGEALLAKYMGKKRSSPKPVPDSTAWPWPPPPPILASSAMFTWDRWTLRSRLPMWQE